MAVTGNADAGVRIAYKEGGNQRELLAVAKEQSLQTASICIYIFIIYYYYIIIIYILLYILYMWI